MLAYLEADICEWQLLADGRYRSSTIRQVAEANMHPQQMAERITSPVVLGPTGGGRPRQ